MRIFIDDIRTPKNKYDLILRSSEETIKYLEGHQCPDFISFDHDLGDDDTAMIIIKWLINKDLDTYENTGENYIPNSFSFNVHSANPVGSANINGYLNSYLTQIKKR